MISRRRPITLLLPALLAAAEPGLSFPPAETSRMVDARALGVKGDGASDDTAALRSVFKAHNGGGQVILLRAGTYLISDTIRFEGNFWNTILQGEGPERTVIRLKASSPGFGDAAKHKAMLYTGKNPAQRFRNAVRDLAIEVEAGNPGAIGLDFCANNQGCVRNVTIRALDPRTGAVGLGLIQMEVGPLLVQDLRVEGFAIGVKVRAAVNSVTLDRIALWGQRQAGLDNQDNQVFCLGLRSENAVPAVVNGGACGSALVVDGELKGIGSGTAAAVVNRHANATVFLRDVRTPGYAAAVQDPDRGRVPGPELAEWCSDAPGLPFPGEAATLRLPVPEFPRVPWDDPATWVSPERFGGSPEDRRDDSAAIQAAIDSGATTVFLPRPKSPAKERPGGWQVAKPVVIRGAVRRIIGLEAEIRPVGELQGQGKEPLFLFADGEAPAVVLERLTIPFGYKFSCPMVLHRAQRDLVIGSFTGLRNLRHEGPGRLFIEDVVGDDWRVGPGAPLYAKQLNLEGGGWKIENQGGLLWVLGLKTEAAGPVLLTTAGGRSEILGCHLYTCVKTKAPRLGFLTEEGASCTVAGGGEYAWTPSWGSAELFSAVRGGATRSVPVTVLNPRDGGRHLPLLVERPGSGGRGSAPAAPRVTLAEASAGGALLQLTAEDPDGDLAGFRIERDGHQVGLSTGRFRDKGLKPGRAYAWTVTAFDRQGHDSPRVTASGATPADAVPPGPPLLARIIEVTDLRAVLAWKPGKDEIGIAGYRIDRVPAPGASGSPAVLRSEACEATDPAVEPGARYLYRIHALDEAGNASDPAELAVQVPAGPPTQVERLATRAELRHEATRDLGGYLGNLHTGTWVLFRGVELGRETPFDTLTLRLACDPGREGAVISVFLDPQVRGEGKEATVEGGTRLGEIPVPSTGGFTSWKELSLPVAIRETGTHDLLLRVARGSSKQKSALVNLDRVRISRRAGAAGP